MRKNCSSDREKLLKFEAKGREFAKILRSLEQFIQAVKGQNSTCFWRFLKVRKGYVHSVIFCLLTNEKEVEKLLSNSISF